MELVEKPLYDLILLDFGNVGEAFGADQGLSLLRHIKRLNPAIVVLSYTSKALETKHADFYRLADGVLAKDAGIQESLERIEEGLRKAHSLENHWNALLQLCEIPRGSPVDVDWQNKFVKGLSNGKKLQKFREVVQGILTSEPTRTAATTILAKLTELGIQALFPTTT